MSLAMLRGRAERVCYHAKQYSKEPDFGDILDRSRTDCLRCLNSNPDMVRNHVVGCFCGQQVNCLVDWYVMTGEGCVQCTDCARCSRCRIDCTAANRRLVSIGGMVLCYRCLESFGYREYPSIKFRLVAKSAKNKSNVEDAGQTPSSEDASSVSAPTLDPEQPEAQEATLERLEAETRRLPSPPPTVGELRQKQEQRKQKKVQEKAAKRRQLTDQYEKQLKQLQKRRQKQPLQADGRRRQARRFVLPSKPAVEADNMGIVPPPYDATPTNLLQMKCPACNKRAGRKLDGKKAAKFPYTVAAMARVYHRGCFKCRCCSQSLAYGTKLPNRHFMFCTCEPPMVWCMRVDCQESRYHHHASAGCHLGQVRPGGRLQVDPDSLDPTVK